MQEVNIRLKLTQPSLGFIKRKVGSGNDVIYAMPRDCQQRVMFLASWWFERMQYAAKVLGRCYNDITNIAWATHIDGPLGQWKRTILQPDQKKRARYALHEAFRPGVVIGVTAVIPDGITIDDLRELLQIVGTYKGVSPYQSPTEIFGTFEVVSVMPTIRTAKPQVRSPVT